MMKKIAVGLVVLLSIAGNAFFAVQYVRNNPPPSFYYRLKVKNGTSDPYLRVSLIQLTDVLMHAPVPPGTWKVIEKGQEAMLQFPGEGDEPGTAFCLVAVGCDRKGGQVKVPAERVVHKILPFSAFRSNTFREANADGSRMKTLCIIDNDMQSVNTLAAGNIVLDGCP